jgi:hypothetical protein
MMITLCEEVMLLANSTKVSTSGVVFFWFLFYSRYWVIFPIENNMLFSQSTGKHSQLKVTKQKI